MIANNFVGKELKARSSKQRIRTTGKRIKKTKTREVEYERKESD